MSPLKTYTVAMSESEVWYIQVTAASEEEAKAKARAAREENGYDDFSFKYGETDGFEIMDEEEAA
jgi:hypothetical protein